MMGDWTNDLRYAVRALLRSPGFAAVTIGTLGLAIGANAGIFSVADTVLVDPLPYPEADRLVFIGASAPGSDMPEEFGVSTEFYLQYAEQADLLENVSTYNDFTNTLRVGDRTERVWMSVATTSLFHTLQVSPILGRLPVPEDESQVAVISHELWTTWFGADSSVIGSSHYIAGENRTVIGVMGPDFWFPNDGVLLWIPFVVREDEVTTGRFGRSLVGRVAPGTDREALVGQLGTLASRLPERFGGSANYVRLIEQHQPVVRSLEQELLGAVSGPLWILLGAAGIVLLIACANVANLFIVRTESRQRDLAVRRALGATRGRLIRTQMAEAVVIAGLGGILAVLLAWVTVPLFLGAAPSDIPRLNEVGISIPTLLFTLGAALFCALICGLVPALRYSVPSLTRLRDEGRGSTRRRHWWRDGLVAGQTALALVLLIGSGLLIRSFQELRSVDPGYETDDIFTFQIAPEADHLTDAPSYARFHLGFMDQIATLPGVQTVGLIENVPLNEGARGGRFVSEDMGSEVDSGVLLNQTWAGGNYFGTMGIEVLRGRTFTRADHISDLGNVIISRAAAEAMWQGEDPIGRRLRMEDDEAWETVVGVVEDVMQNGFREAPEPLIYYSLVGQAPDSRALSSPAYVVKTTRAETIGPEILAMVREIAPNAPMYRMFTMAGLASDSMVRLSFTMLTLGLASAMALILGAVGLFGVLSYVVAQRTREIGVRMALGADAKRVQSMVVLQGARVVGIGIVLGVAVAVVSTRILGTLLYGVESADVGTFVGMSSAMIVVGLLASYMPARRASTVDPIEALRGD